MVSDDECAPSASPMSYTYDTMACIDRECPSCAWCYVWWRAQYYGIMVGPRDDSTVLVVDRGLGAEERGKTQDMMYNVWYVMYDMWYMIYDIWCMIYDIWHGVGERGKTQDGRATQSRNSWCRSRTRYTIKTARRGLTLTLIDTQSRLWEEADTCYCMPCKRPIHATACHVRGEHHITLASNGSRCLRQHATHRWYATHGWYATNYSLTPLHRMFSCSILSSDSCA